jgi:hypothetical protein
MGKWRYNAKHFIFGSREGGIVHAVAVLPPSPRRSVEGEAGWTQGAGLESLERGKSLHLPGTQNLFSSNAPRYLVMLLSELPRPTSGRFVRLA